MNFIVNAILSMMVLLVAAMIGIAQYDPILFAARLHPYSQAYVNDLMKLKRQAAAKITERKLVVVSGSSGLHGIRCSILADRLNLPCINGGLPIELGAPAIFGFDKSLIRPGDVTLLPLEFDFYFLPAYGGAGEGKAVAGDVGDLSRLQVKQFFRMDFNFFLSAFVENVVALTGYRSFDVAVQFTPEGDRRLHTRELAKAFAQNRSRQTFEKQVFFAGYPITSEMKEVLREFFAWAKANNITVIGTIQPIYDDWKLPQRWLTEIPALFGTAGYGFTIPPGYAQYPRDCFWDSWDHLNEECQLAHTQILADTLATEFPEIFK